jgi:tetratricopeptide (TPR) repeat protein
VAEADALSEQVAVKVSDIVDQATRALGPRAGSIDSETLAAYLKMSDRMRFGPRMSAGENLAVDRQIVTRAPDFARGHANLAFDLAASARSEPPEIASAMRAEAREEVRRALKLDPKLGDAYSALAELEDIGNYAAREALLRKGLLIDPQNPSLNNYLGDLYRSVGRLREAEPLYRRGLLLDPLSPSKTSSNIFGLAGSGDQAAAEALMQRGIRLFPEHVVLRRSIIYSTLLYGPPDLALARLHALSGLERLMGPAAVGIWQAYAEDRRRGQIERSTLRRIIAGADADIVDPSTALSALAQSGDVDGAFGIANAAVDRRATLYVTVLFDGATLAMRRDPRFMALAARLGLVDYWRRSGVWPDFCAEPGLPYDCKAAAAGATGQGR